MQMKILNGLILAIVLSAIVLEPSVSALRRGGGSRGGSRGGYRGSSRGSSTRRSSTRRKFSPSGTSRVTKNTPIPVRSKTSPVIVKQTKVRSRPNLATKVFVGYMAYRYTIHSAPVYRSRYPLYRSEVAIPDKRAIRVNYIEENVFDADGKACLEPDHQGVIHRNASVTFVNTEVSYDGGQPTNYFGENQTVHIDKSILDQSIRVSTIVKYNGSIILNTNCTQIQNVMDGTVIQMYATNPDKAGQVKSSILVVIVSCVLFYIMYK